MLFKVLRYFLSVSRRVALSTLFIIPGLSLVFHTWRCEVRNAGKVSRHQCGFLIFDTGRLNKSQLFTHMMDTSIKIGP